MIDTRRGSDHERAKSEAFVNFERGFLSSLAVVVNDVALEIGVLSAKPRQSCSMIPTSTESG